MRIERSRDGNKVAEGNQLADCQARKAALYGTPSLQMPLIWTGPVEQEKPQYTEEELERYEKRRAKITNKGWLRSSDQSFHLGIESTYQLASRVCLFVCFEGKNVKFKEHYQKM